MSIKSLPIMTAATTIAPDTSVDEALKVMVARQINHVAVCDGERYLGLISVNDILRRLLPAGVQMPHGVPDLKFAGDASRLLASHFRHLRIQKVAEIIEAGEVLDENCPVLEAALLLSKSPTPLAVVDGGGRLVGMLSRRGLLKHLAQQAGQ